MRLQKPAKTSGFANARVFTSGSGLFVTLRARARSELERLHPALTLPIITALPSQLRPGLRAAVCGEAGSASAVTRRSSEPAMAEKAMVGKGLVSHSGWP